MLFGGGTGREKLERWLGARARADAASKVALLEEALLSGRFVRYAWQRLAVFGLARAVGIFVHLVELTWLYEIFGAKPFVASVALQNVTLVADAFFWGALEGLRRRLRELGPTSEGTALVSRWLTLAAYGAVAVVALPVGVYVIGKPAHGMLHLYAGACALRLAADLVLRTYYSGIFAYGRVHRPLATTLAGPLVLLGGTLALWERLAGYSFVVALVASVVVSRGLFFVYVRRAYRRARLPQPRLRFIVRSVDALRRVGGVFDRTAFLAGIANLSTRLGGVVLLAALVPSLTSVATEEVDEAGEALTTVEPFAFSLHLAAPFILLAAQWAFVFYHDWKRLEDEASSRLAARLDRHLVATGALVGAGCAVVASALVLVYVPWSQAWPTLASLAVATIGLAIWTSLQLRRFSHGEHLAQTSGAVALAVVVLVALSSSSLGLVAFHLALAVGPWVAIASLFVAARFRRPVIHGELGSVAAFVRALEAGRTGPRVVWSATALRRPALVAARLAGVLGDRGALVRVRDRILWFERTPERPAAEPRSRADWLVAGGGLLVDLDRVATSAADARVALASAGVLHPPSDAHTVDALVAEHRRTFPDGFVVRVGHPPPPAFAALAPSVRQAIWRDALRGNGTSRGRSGWFVATLTASARGRPRGAPDVPTMPNALDAHAGAPDVVFVAPRTPAGAPAFRAFRARVAEAQWREGRREGRREATRDATRDGRGPNAAATRSGDAAKMPAEGADPGIVEA